MKLVWILCTVCMLWFSGLGYAEAGACTSFPKDRVDDLNKVMLVDTAKYLCVHNYIKSLEKKVKDVTAENAALAKINETLSKKIFFLEDTVLANARHIEAITTQNKLIIGHSEWVTSQLDSTREALMKAEIKQGGGFVTRFQTSTWLPLLMYSAAITAKELAK